MGSPLSPVVANLFMEDFEEKAIASYGKKPSLWLRYVDDTFIIWPHGAEELQKFLQHLNSQHQAIKFTMETEHNGQLPFLDVLVKRKSNGLLGHAVHRKKTHTDRYLNASSHHHPMQKISLVATLIHRAYAISDTESLSAEKKHLIEALERNGYSRSMVNRRFAEQQNKDAAQKRTSEEENRPEPEAYATIPFVAGTSEKIARVLRKHNVITRFNCVTKISDKLPGAKDKIPQDLHEGVYRVPCSCGEYYIGETCRSMKIRLQEHRRATKNKQHQLSAISEHAWSEPGHNILFEDAKILAKESKYFPRLIREAIEIVKTPANFNRDQGYHLHNAWKRILQPPTNGRPAMRDAQPPTNERAAPG